MGGVRVPSDFAAQHSMQYFVFESAGSVKELITMSEPPSNATSVYGVQLD